MSKYRPTIEDVPSTPTLKPKPAPEPDLFTGHFRCVGMARTPAGFVTVTVDFGADGLMTAMTIGRPQSAPHGQPYIAGEALKILQMACLGS